MNMTIVNMMFLKEASQPFLWGVAPGCGTRRAATGKLGGKRQSPRNWRRPVEKGIADRSCNLEKGFYMTCLLEGRL